METSGHNLGAKNHRQDSAPASPGSLIAALDFLAPTGRDKETGGPTTAATARRTRSRPTSPTSSPTTSSISTSRAASSAAHARSLCPNGTSRIHASQNGTSSPSRRRGSSSFGLVRARNAITSSRSRGDGQDNAESSVLTALVWKRRTGLGGKLSSKTNAWERRRIELRGSVLTYHKTAPQPPQQEQLQQRDAESKKHRSSSSSTSTSASAWLYSNAKYVSDNARYAANYAATTLTEAAMVVPYSSAATSSSSSNEGQHVSDDHDDGAAAAAIPNDRRGALDLTRERATVAARRSRAPTPFALSIRAGYVASGYYDTHWFFCFDTREEQMTWLAALTDAVARRSRHDFDTLKKAKVAAEEGDDQHAFASSRELMVSWDNNCDGDVDVGGDSTAREAPSSPGSATGRVDVGDLDPQSPPSPSRSSVASGRGDDLDFPPLQQQDQRLTATAWKQRSGFGKRVKNMPWSRRRIALEGSRIMYYKLSGTPDKGDDNTDDDEEEDDFRSSDGELSVVVDAEGESSLVASDIAIPVVRTFDDAEAASQDLPQAAPPAPLSLKPKPYHPTALYQKTKDNIKYATTNVIKTKTNHRQRPFTDSYGVVPRGYLDIIKEEAAVVASYPVASSPSPFGLTVIVKGEPKWKLCFDVQAEQMLWLAALTDIVVSKSVEEYNAEGKGDDAFEPIDIPTKSLKFVLQSRGVRRDTLEMIAPDVNGRALYSSSCYDPVKPGHHKQWVVTTRNLILILILVNALFFLSHAYPLSAEHFWYAIAFLNIGIWMCFGKKEEGLVHHSPPSPSDIPIREMMLPTPTVIPTVGGGDDTMYSEGTGVSPVSAEDQGVSTRSGIPVVPNCKPIAGTTTIQVNEPGDSATNKNGHEFAKWRTVPGTIFDVRSHGYLSSKVKVPSPSELYRLVTVDIFESQARVADVAGKVRLPKVSFEDSGAKKTWTSPDIFIVSFALPTEPPSIYRPTTDGQGYTVTIYYAMKESTRAILREITAPDYDATADVDEQTDVQKRTRNAVRLFEEWCRRSPNDEAFQARFKVLILGQNLKEIGIPSWIAKYNGKPFLIKRAGITGFLYEHHDVSAMEFDISFHHFPYLFKQGTALLKESFFQKVIASFGFVIEGRQDDELPEVVIGEGMQICYPDPAIAIQAKDLFEGKSAKASD